MSCETNYSKVDIKEISDKLKDTKRALVDRAYVNYQGNHLFEYDINFSRFLEDIDYILKQISQRKEKDEF